MGRMFADATVFNQALTFNTSSVTDMDEMFRNAESFNQALTFDTSSVTTMHYMFIVRSAHALDPPAFTASPSRRA